MDEQTNSATELPRYIVTWCYPFGERDATAEAYDSLAGAMDQYNNCMCMGLDCTVLELDVKSGIYFVYCR